MSAAACVLAQKPTTDSAPVPSRKGTGKLWNHLQNSASRAQYLEASDMEPAGTCSSMNTVSLNWRNEGPRQDCVFVVTNPDRVGFQGMDVVHVLCFFSFSLQGPLYPCAIICWFNSVGDAPNDNTGMWVVKPSVTAGRQPKFTVIHTNSNFHAAHLIPVFTSAPQPPPQGTHPHHSYNHFHLFYVNKFANHHAFATAF